MIKRISMSFVEWCKQVVESSNYVILDTETTGFSGEVIDLGIIDAQGNILYDGLLKPTCAIEESAEAVHHISETMVSAAPCFAGEWPEIWKRIKGKSIIAYNAKFDSGRLQHTAIAHKVQMPEMEWYCAMLGYSDFYAEPGRYHGQYKWQRLEDALGHQDILLGTQQHRALWDAQATVALIKGIATLGDKAMRWQIRNWDDVAQRLSS